MNEQGEVVVSNTPPAREPFPPKEDGDVFLDGSCKNPRSRNAARAGWACVQVVEKGAFVRSLSGTVPYAIKQAAVTGEYGGILNAIANVERGIFLLGDCMGVVQNFYKSYAGAAGPTKKFANYWREMHHLVGGWSDFANLLKVKAHVDKSKLEDEGEIYYALGNDLADIEAKEAVDRHRCGPADLEKAAFHQCWTKEVAVPIGTFLGKLPSTMDLYVKLSEEEIAEEREQAQDQSLAQPTAATGVVKQPLKHSWVQIGSKWRCRTCMRQSAQQEACRVPCGIIPLSLQTAVASRFGHKRMTARTVHIDTWCMSCALCGGGVGQKAVTWKKPCEGSARLGRLGHANVTLKAVKKRNHPVTGEALTVPWPLAGLP